MFKWFKGPDEGVSYVASDEFSIRVSEIKRRIASIKSDRGWNKKPTKISSTQSKPMVEKATESNHNKSGKASQKLKKDTELNDLKAKLMKGRK